MGPLEYFFHDVPRVFIFLEDKYGFERLRHGTDPRGYAGWVPYRNSTTEVLIQYEFGSAPWIVLSPIRNGAGAPVPSGSVSLEFMIAEAGGREEVPVPAPTETSNEAISAILQEKASWLRRLGDDFLSGRFDGFYELSRRQEQAHLRRAREFDAEAGP